MGNVNANISPVRLNQGDHVDAMGVALLALRYVCQGLDADGGITATTFEANAITALISLTMTGTTGYMFQEAAAESSTIEPHHIISPTGFSDAAKLAAIYQFFNALETVTEQLDADGDVTDVNYEALCYTAIMTQLVENIRGNTLGNGTVFKFKPGGVGDQKQTVEFLYNAFLAIKTLAAKLDSDGGVTSTNYEATVDLVLGLMVENDQGDQIGTSR